VPAPGSVFGLHGRRKGVPPQVVPIRALRGYARRHRVLVACAGALVTAGLLALVLSGRRAGLAAAVSSAPLGTLIGAAALQVIALLARTEAWHLSIEAAGGTVTRRVLYRASSMQVLGSLLSGQLGAAARMVALRRAGTACPRLPTLIAAEVPILSVEISLAALASFTLIGPLGLPWWSPLVAAAAIGLGWAALHRLALCSGRELWRGLAVIRSRRGGWRVASWVLVAVFGQIFRNWMLLHAVGVDASFFDAIAVLIAVVTLAQLPAGPAVGAAAAVLILGAHGVAATAAAGVLMTATGTAGALAFATWAGADRLWAHTRAAGLR